MPVLTVRVCAGRSHRRHDGNGLLVRISTACYAAGWDLFYRRAIHGRAGGPGIHRDGRDGGQQYARDELRRARHRQRHQQVCLKHPGGSALDGCLARLRLRPGSSADGCRHRWLCFSVRK
ncbi:MAG: hypothetical protein MZV70_55715 [Desulfobacterales bacterium]|nr:hypothetical protein [Desulfobacterales bacterium]